MTRVKDSEGVRLGSESLRRQEIKTRVHRRLLETLNLNEARRMSAAVLRSECLDRVDQMLGQERASLSAPEKAMLVREVIDEIFGLGPIEEFLRDPTVSDILVNGPEQVYVERDGKLAATEARFRDDDHVLQMIQRIAARVGRRIDESSPMLDARLADGSRVNAIIPPLSLGGPVVSIRRFGTNPIDVEKLLEFNSLTEEMLRFLQGCVRARLNLLISGGGGAGKTTLLNMLSKWIPAGERVVTIEDAAELRLPRDHVVRLETRPPNIEGHGEVTQRDLVRNSLRMRPDRIIVGEARGSEALDMLQAMNTGHDGSMTTVHANSSRDALSRVENMVAMGGFNFPVRTIRVQIVSALSIVIHVARLTGGRRKVVDISEVTGMEGDVICLQEVFRFRQTGLGADGHAQGSFEACGVLPRALERLSAEGIHLPRDLFERRVLAGPSASGGGG